MKYMTKEEALSFLLTILENNEDGPLVVAVDGRSASGKTSFAAEIQSRIGVPVIHTDDFFRPRNKNGDIEMSDYNGNFDICRFKHEVVERIKSKCDFTIGIFDCKEGRITDTVIYPSSQAYVVEGAYSLHPELENYWNVSVFFDIEPDEQKERIISRNGIEQLPAFQKLWIPAEERYFAEYNIQNTCDIIVRT